MEPKSGNIKVTRTARYFTLGDNTLPLQTVVYVLHGYGMSAKEFIAQFECLVKPGVMIVAPEGLSRFYRKGFSGDVIASWMTKEDRLAEIEDYVGYLDSLHRLVVSGKDVITIVLGFSQGVATASRWLYKGAVQISDFIVWCGEFAVESDKVPLKLPVIRHVFAHHDTFITPEQVEKQSLRLRSLGGEVYNYGFDGGHIIDNPTLLTVFRDAGI